MAELFESELLNWDPFELWRSVWEGPSWERPFRRAAETELPVNVWVGPEDAVVTAELPGVDPEALEVTAEDGTLRIAGERKPVAEADGLRHFKRERPAGRFQRSLVLPFRPEPGEVEATYTNGVLTVRLPRAREERPRRIAVQAR